jgi:predicted nucleotidyltransferase
MNKIRNDLPDNYKKFFIKLQEYLDTDLYFYGSVNRNDYIHEKSDIDIAIFTDNEKSMMVKIQHFLNNNKNKYNKKLREKLEEKKNNNKKYNNEKNNENKNNENKNNENKNNENKNNDKNNDKNNENNENNDENDENNIRFDKIIWKLYGQIIYGYKIKCNKYIDINCEIAVYNNNFKEILLKDFYPIIPNYIYVLLFILKTFYYNIPIIPTQIYTKCKRYIFNEIIAQKHDTIFYLLKNKVFRF